MIDFDSSRGETSHRQQTAQCSPYMARARVRVSLDRFHEMVLRVAPAPTVERVRHAETNVRLRQHFIDMQSRLGRFYRERPYMTRTVQTKEALKRIDGGQSDMRSGPGRIRVRRITEVTGALFKSLLRKLSGEELPP